MEKENSENDVTTPPPTQPTKDFNTENECISFFDLRTRKGQILFFLITISVPILFQFLPNDFYQKFAKDYCNVSSSLYEHVDRSVIHEQIEEKRPTYWVFGRDRNGNHLKHVHLVLNRLGLRQGDNESDWDLLWAHDYPFGKLQTMMINLKPHQKVNHLPGCGYITNKVDLATTNIKYIPKSFKLPAEEEQLKEHSKLYPTKKFVQKNNQHRNIEIKVIDEIDFKNNESFVQEYIDNPLLVDGHKFDIGVYTIITSINPLRAYIYNGDILLRYCPVKYYPFDPKIVDKYIVGDDYLPTWDVPSLSQYYNDLGFGMKGSFDGYMQSKGRDPSVMWEKVEDAIRLVLYQKEKFIANILSQKYRNKKNFFELMRFDLIADDNFDVYMMEANMSPNLSSAHFPPNQLLYEQVLYHAFSLLGVASLIERESFRKQMLKTETMMSSDKNIVVDPVECSQIPCTGSCELLKCRLCRPCLSASDIMDLHEAYREHLRRGDTKRIVPKPIKNYKLDEDELKQLTPKNQFMTKWFYGKCKLDVIWCS